MERLSIIKIDQDEEINLNTNQADIYAITIKLISNLVPYGSPIGDLIANIIPNQKMSRLVKLVEKLNENLNQMEQKVAAEKFKTPEFADLFEEGANQASKAISEERLEYIASLLKNGLSVDELGHIEKKKLLTMLGELNDPEIICLQYHALYADERVSYMEKHNNILLASWTSSQSSFSEFDCEALQRNHTEELIRRGLLTEMFNLNLFRGQMPEHEPETGRPKRSGLEVSTLGNALLRIIDLLPSDDQNRRFYWNT